MKKETTKQILFETEESTKRALAILCAQKNITIKDYFAGLIAKDKELGKVLESIK